MIKLYLYKKFDKQYAQKIQFFCKILFFGLSMKNKSGISTLSSRKVNQHFLKNIINKAQEKSLLLNTNMIIIVEPSS